MIPTWLGWSASACRNYSRSCSPSALVLRLSPALSVDRSFRFIRGLTRTCCPSRWSWSSSAARAVCSAPSSAASSWASFTISARHSCRNSLTSCSFFRCCLSCCCGRKAFSAGMCHERTFLRTRHRARGARHPAVLDDRCLLHQCRQPDPVLCDICARTERAGGLRRPGFAGPCRPVRRDRLRSRLHSATWLRALAGNSRRFSDQHSVDGRLRSALPARDRYRLHHDYVGAGRNPLGAGLSLDQPHRRRQWIKRADSSGSVRLLAVRREHVLLRHLDYILAVTRDHNGVCPFATGRRAHGHA